MDNKSSLEVFAQKFLQVQQAKRTYLKHLKAAPKIKKAALEDYKKEEDELETMAYGVLNPHSRFSSYSNRGGGGISNRMSSMQ